jgi:SagB-type dehydrogenase family enzyme
MSFPIRSPKLQSTDDQTEVAGHDARVCRDYEKLILRRGVDPAALVPVTHHIDWDDQPSRYKIYYDAPRTPLSAHLPKSLAPMAAAATRPQRDGRQAGGISFEELSTLLAYANGVMARKLDVNCNLEHRDLVQHARSMFARPTASGGGMYPFEIYVVAGSHAPVLPGVYHYDNAHHALARLSLGDVTERIHAATFGKTSGSDCFILISLYFWKNYFKYHNFSYHVVTQDLGAAVGSTLLLANALNVESKFVLWFQDEVLNRTLGLETNRESVFGVIALGGGAESEEQAADGGQVREAERLTASAVNGALTARQSFQRSRRLFELPLLEQVHQATLLEDEESRPTHAEIARARCEVLEEDNFRLPLPPSDAELLRTDLLSTFRERTTGWGKLTPHPPLEIEKLAELLRFSASLRTGASDMSAGLETGGFTRLMLFANQVQGLPAGVYSFDEERDSLLAVSEGEHALELQQHYFLQNHNFEQAAAIIAIVGDMERMLDVFGNRGMRILNAEVGIVTQALYMSASAMSVGCGAVLGYENLSVNRLLGLEGTTQTALLLLLVGNIRAGQGRFDFRLL